MVDHHLKRHIGGFDPILWVQVFSGFRPMSREEAFVLLKQHLGNENLIKHSLAVEAAMGALADHFGEDATEWSLAGLLHDVDYEQTKDQPEKHSLVGAEMLRKAGFSEELVESVKTHNEMHGQPPVGLMARALYCLDPLTGLIVAAALVLPNRRLKDLTAESVRKRFQEKSFARGADREIIMRCRDHLGLELDEFIDITLRAMQNIDRELGLD